VSSPLALAECEVLVRPTEVQGILCFTVPSQPAKRSSPNDVLHLTGAASTLFRSMIVSQAAPAGELCRSARESIQWQRSWAEFLLPTQIRSYSLRRASSNGSSRNQEDPLALPRVVIEREPNLRITINPAPERSGALFILLFLGCGAGF